MVSSNNRKLNRESNEAIEPRQDIAPPVMSNGNVVSDKRDYALRINSRLSHQL